MNPTPEFDLLSMLSVGAGPGNDDRAGRSADFAWVLDGATDLIDTPLVGQRSDAEWLADFAHSWLTTHAAQQPPDRCLRDILTELTHATADAFSRQQRRAPSARFEIPSAAALIARRSPTGITYISVGDCTMLATTADGTSRFGTDAHDAGDQWLETVIRQHRARTPEHTAEPLRTALIPDLKSARDRMNQPGGYGVLSISEPPDAFVVHCQIDLPKGTRVLLATDGLMRLIDVFARYDDTGLMTAIADRGLPELLSELRRIEADDEACIRYPRAKTSDDATGLYLSLC
ncbi:MAG: protein phosphatase 2C domain-containing protein [Pseudomonadota bacterium]